MSERDPKGTRKHAGNIKVALDVLPDAKVAAATRGQSLSEFATDVLRRASAEAIADHAKSRNKKG